MFQWFINLDITLKALLASLFTWFLTTLGSSIVFLFKKIDKKLFSSMLGLSAGIMLSASFWSLLSPAKIMAEELELNIVINIFFSLILGIIFLIIGDKVYEKTAKDNFKNSNIFTLILSITLHNIPEGLAVGIAYGSLKYNIEGATLINALILTLGIGIQNIPEGSAISLPLRCKGNTRIKSFIIGSLTGIVEPISAILGSILVLKMRNILPFFLCFAAGSMIYVVIKELIPESYENNKKSYIWILIGFCIMTFLDVYFG